MVEEEKKNVDGQKKPKKDVLYHDIDYALSCDDYIVLIAFDSRISALSVRVNDLQAPTECLE